MNIIFLLFFAAIIISVLAIIAAIVVIIVTKSKNKNQLHDFNTYKAMANNLTISNQEIRAELSELKEKVNSIEKLLKEVE